ncbi:multidrug effflux MFS transporter [Chlorobium sp. BLA1]|uniref:multidrug effflux MFS transporter n=1 Tax=Candidatus Chlorobium masyuteum TaxID=2716876 RepID=UPI0014217C15|nr:multidrug effflux MFS transporter [Candidatus Chlorobium masyuteum]NHQ60277.1 multidrug effflux MFS transporter [Candidatus Chlorobium masyuteum]
MARKKRAEPGFAEFITLTALMMSLVALSIDTMLPALADIGKELGVHEENTNQLILSILFLGMASGQLLYGPISDSTGRKPAIYLGYALFITGTLFSLVAQNFPVMLAGRFLQGFGTAGPRIVSIAIVRDRYEGSSMARVMSFVMTVFILVPIVAPAIGQGIVVLSGWRAIFGTFLVFALLSIAWFALRQPETLKPENRIPFSFKRMTATIRSILENRSALGYTVTAGLVSGYFLGYLNSAQQIFQEEYALGERFPLYFAALALSIGSASFVNARLLLHHSMQSLSRKALLTIGTLSVAFLLLILLQENHPPLWQLMLYLFLTFFSTGILFGNLNALAMETLGSIAGIGSGIVGSLSTFISLIVGTAIGQSYNGTVLPLTTGFFILSIISLGAMHWAEKEKQLTHHPAD